MNQTRAHRLREVMASLREQETANRAIPLAEDFIKTLSEHIKIGGDTPMSEEEAVFILANIAAISLTLTLTGKTDIETHSKRAAFGLSALFAAGEGAHPANQIILFRQARKKLNEHINELKAEAHELKKERP